MKPRDINRMINILSQVATSSLEYWLRRVAELRAADDSSSDHHPLLSFLFEHRQPILGLLSTAAPLPDAQATAARLAVVMHRAMCAYQQYDTWLPILRRLAVALYDTTIDDPVLAADLWSGVSDCYRHMGDLQRAEQALFIARHLAAGEYAESAFDLHHRLLKEHADVMALQMRFQEAEQTARVLLVDAYARSDLYTGSLARSLLTYISIQEYRFEAAFEHAQQAYVDWTVLAPNSREQAQALHFLAEAARLCQLPDHALQALFLLAQHPVVLADPRWRVLVDQTCGALAADRGDFVNAFEHLGRARTFFKEAQDRRKYIVVTHALGVARFRARYFTQAERLLGEAAAGWLELGNRFEQANVCYALGKVYVAQRRPQDARLSFLKALEIARQLTGVNHAPLLANLEAELDGLSSEPDAP